MINNKEQYQASHQEWDDIEREDAEYNEDVDAIIRNMTDTLNQNDDEKFCDMCMNAYCNPDLDPGCDFSSRSLGSSIDGYRIMLNTGAHRKTHITLEHRSKGWETCGIYVPKYCPECGRKLHENEKGDGLYIINDPI